MENTTWLCNAQFLVEERNNRESLPFLSIYTRQNHLQNKHHRLQQKHTEIRNQIALLQHEISFPSNQEEKDNIDTTIKTKLSAIQEELSSRGSKDYDEVKIRLELNKSLRERERMVTNLRGEVGSSNTSR